MAAGVGFLHCLTVFEIPSSKLPNSEIDICLCNSSEELQGKGLFSRLSANLPLQICVGQIFPCGYKIRLYGIIITPQYLFQCAALRPIQALDGQIQKRCHHAARSFPDLRKLPAIKENVFYAHFRLRQKRHGKAVVLATGGFGSSDEKLQRYANFFDVDRPVTRFSVPSDTGDAIDMLQELGVEPDPNRLFVSFFGPAHHPYSYSLYRLIEEPTNLSVDLNGVRWQDESGGLFMGRINIAGHPKECTWNIFSQANVDGIFRKFLLDPSLSDEIDCYRHYQEDLDRETTYKVPAVVKADTIEELAEKLGMDAAVLTRTISEYNRFCRQKKDEQFGKDPQFLSFPGRRPVLCSLCPALLRGGHGRPDGQRRLPGTAQRWLPHSRSVRRG